MKQRARSGISILINHMINPNGVTLL